MQTLSANIAPLLTLGPIEVIIENFPIAKVVAFCVLAFIGLGLSYSSRALVRPKPARGADRKNFDRFFQALKALSLSLAKTASATASRVV